MQSWGTELTVENAPDAAEKASQREAAILTDVRIGRLALAVYRR